MRELLSISLGPTSNFTSAHFWNFQDELLKQDETLYKNNALFYETSSTQQLIPRAIFVDFRQNFGNYSSIFATKQRSIGGSSQQWGGKIQKIEQERLAKSKYQQQLDRIDEEMGVEEAEEQRKAEEQKYNGELMKAMQSQFSKGFSQKSSAFSKLQAQEEEQKMVIREAAEHQSDLKKQGLKNAMSDPADLKKFYESFRFNEQTNYFTDFMQSAMTSKNQLILPSSTIQAEEYQAYYQGSQMWDGHADLRDGTDDAFRNQLEYCDMIQGMNITLDWNSGHASFAQKLIQNLIKDEIPKAPICLFSIKNGLYKSLGKGEQIKTDVIKINQALYLADMSESCDLILPFDQIQLGHHQQDGIHNYMNNSVYHESALIASTIDNILYKCYSKQNQVDMKDMINSVLYGEKPNIALLQHQFPYQIKEGDRMLENLKIDQLIKGDYFINFAKMDQGDQHPIRHSFICRGLDSLLQAGERSNVMKDELEQFIHKHTQYQRGFQTTFINQPQLLPIPFPRFFTDNVFNDEGIVKYDRSADSFVSTVPSLTKVICGGEYLPVINACVQSIRKMKMGTRAQLMKEGQIEEDDFREKVECLENLAEQMRAFRSNDEAMEDQEGDDDDY